MESAKLSTTHIVSSSELSLGSPPRSTALRGRPNWMIRTLNAVVVWPTLLLFLLTNVLGDVSEQLLNSNPCSSRLRQLSLNSNLPPADLLHHHHLLVLTSVTEDILQDYASYSLGINYNYARRHDYAFWAFLESPKAVTDLGLDADSRWNKVKLLLEITSATLSYSTTTGDNTSWIAWVDADLVILDQSLDLVSLTQLHPQADLIMSQDKVDAPFVGNTGFILIRVTNWSVSFLQRWWSRYDRQRCCDQHALTWLLLDDEDRGHTVFLPATELNSDFPVWKTFDSNNSVLHLAGASSLLRREVFRYAASNLCSTNNNSSDSMSLSGGENQLGITREYLKVQVRGLGNERLRYLEEWYREWLASDRSLSSTLQARRRLLAAMKVAEEEESEQDSRVQQSLQTKLADVQEEVFRTVVSLVLSLLSSSSTLYDLTPVVEAVSMGIEVSLLHGQQGRSDSARIILGEVEKVIQVVLTASDIIHNPAVEGRFLYYGFKHAQLMGWIVGRQHSEHWLERAAQLWITMQQRTGYTGSDYVSAEPMKEYIDVVAQLGSLRCANKNWLAGIDALEEAIRLQRQTISSFAILHVTTLTVEHDANRDLADMLYNLGLCYAEGFGLSHEQGQKGLQALLEVLELLPQGTTRENARLLLDKYGSDVLMKPRVLVTKKFKRRRKG